MPTYKRPEYLARIVRLLNDYYVRMADVQEWEEEALALKEEYKLLGKCLDALRVSLPLGWSPDMEPSGTKLTAGRAAFTEYPQMEQRICRGRQAKA